MKKLLLPLLTLILIWTWKSCLPISLFSSRNPSSETRHTIPTCSIPSEQILNTNTTEANRHNAPIAIQEGQLEIPIFPTTLKGQQIVHEGYTTHYNTLWLIPNWVAYELTPEEAKGTIPRNGEFQPDPMVQGKSSTKSDYNHSGYDRGHMAPAGDMKFSYRAMHESFYTSNICPQFPQLNTGLWATLEKKVRKWAKNGETIAVTCGPIVQNTKKTIGKNKVVVPQRFFKVLCKRTNNQTYTIGFIFPNEACKGNIYNYSTSVDAVEKLTGFDFFSLLPDEEEEIAEKSTDLRVWQ